MRSTFHPLAAQDRYAVLIVRAQPRDGYGRVVGIYPGGMLRVAIIKRGVVSHVKLLPSSVTRICERIL